MVKLTDPIEIAENYARHKEESRLYLDNLAANQDNIKIVSEEHLLKPTLMINYLWTYNKGSNGGYIQDYTNVSRTIKVIGTKKQIFNFFRKTKYEIKDSWKAELKAEHIKMYKINNNKLIIINLK
jgi:hypothetical protein|tara:strand:+ start:181 stop:555 length:375 start_codon:yes stop_codon:yes gene_type:complete